MKGMKRMKGVLQRVLQRGTLLLAVVMLAGALPVTPQDAAYPELDQQLEPLKAQFNADAGKVRLILLLDPT